MRASTGASISRRSCLGATLALLWACSPASSTPRHDADLDDGGRDAEGDGEPDADVEPDGDAQPACLCLPGAHNDRIYVVSDEAELWSYDPRSNAFELITLARCFGSQQPYSMSLDRAGRAWVLYSDVEDVYTIDVNAPGSCEDPGYVPRREGFGLFGMAFVNRSDADLCPRLYLMSYSGDGPFSEGDDIGALGALDTATMEVTRLGPTDYDGGELAGTGDGRLFAFAGVGPVKLVEYDALTGEVLEVTPLDGMSKTNASAMAFFGGDLFIFTEAEPPGCTDCLTSTCAGAYDDCRADPACLDQLTCALEAGRADDDDCGGGLPADMRECLTQCGAECLPSVRARVSQVTRLDHDGSEGPGRAREVVVEAAPIRVVGAGSSTCVQTIPY